MLVLARQVGQQIIMEHEGVMIVVEVVSLRSGEVKIGVEAPKSVSVDRREIWLKRKRDEEAG